MIYHNLPESKRNLNLTFQLFKYQSHNIIMDFFKILHQRYSWFNIIMDFFKILHHRYSWFNMFKIITFCNISYQQNYVCNLLKLESVCPICEIFFLCLQFCTSNLYFLLPEFRNNEYKIAVCTFFLEVAFH